MSNAQATPTIELDASERPIKAVTVFNSHKAEVVRTFKVELNESQNEIHITSIPSCVDTDSARITGLGDAILFDVVCTAPEGHGGLFARPASSPAIAALERKRAALQGERNLQGHAANILVSYGQRLSTEDNGGIEMVDAFLDGMLKRGSAALKETEELDAKIAELDRVIESERKNERGRPQLTGSVTAVIIANKQGSVEITLTYMVTNASWSAIYDLHATTGVGHPSSSVSLHYRAAIQQSTGEDWRDTSISVSSATPGQWQKIPPLRAICIRPSWQQNWVHNTANRPGQPFTFGPSGASPTPGALFGGDKNSGVPQQPERPTQAFGGLFGSQPAPPVHPQQQRPLFGQPEPGFALNGSTGLFGISNQPAGLASIHQAPSAPSSTAGVNLPGIASVMGGAFGSFGSATPLGATGSTGPASTAPGASANPQQQQVGSVDLSEEWTNVGMPMSTAPMSDLNSNTAPDAIEGWAETKAVVSESTVASTFRVEGNCSIPSGLTPHKVALAILKFDAKVNYVSVPRSSPNAFLQGEIVNTSEYRLLPGTVNVYLDNSPVSKVFIPDVNPDESFKCTFGPDPSIRIKYTRLPRTMKKASSQFATETSLATYKIRTTIHNKHTFPIIGLIVRDAVPTIDSSSTAAASNNTKVILKHPEGLGEAEVGEMVHVDVNGGEKGKGNSKVKAHWVDDVARKEGKYEWVADIGAGEEVKLDAEFVVRAPSDFNWVLVEDAFV